MNKFDENYCIAKFQAIENASAKEAIEVLHNEGELAGVHLRNISTFNEGKVEMLLEIIKEAMGSDVPREVMRAYWHASEVLMHIGGINLAPIVDDEED